MCILWNCFVRACVFYALSTYIGQEVLEVIRKHKCVVATLTGHDHEGGYLKDDTGMHHVVFQSILESPPGSSCIVGSLSLLTVTGSTAFAIVDAHSTHIEIHGAGLIPNMTLAYSR